MTEPTWSGTVGDYDTAKALPRGHWLYVVSSHDAVLYVGQAKQPFRRLNDHLTPPGCIAWHGGPLTELARDNWDEAQSWTIDVYAATAELSDDEAE